MTTNSTGRESTITSVIEYVCPYCDNAFQVYLIETIVHDGDTPEVIGMGCRWCGYIGEEQAFKVERTVQ